ncbi:Efg1 domain-containing protein [Aspergillus ruber CBS 135680]|uniref:rRNA-processing protein EFG1 n=1 Tax=Aspergillus ruber (strain CBS 135680) TaxID=1388766 RepID=A0A017SPB4_ASPRC|nr:uncharacterized protein EURHEDRAFT_449586 [Aspergillus ruber CBS 135680]EYE98070.1 hypothetical protein EURHEDRAFT_449586 [Aspergillus ruber CBS 135680]
MPKDRHSRDISPAQRDRSAYKRKHREASDDAPPAKKKIQLGTQKREKNEYPSVNELKRRIRAVKRLLEKVDLPADARIVQERALSGYEKDLEDEMQRRDRSQMIKKYHFVRFLDRKSATKDLKRLQRRETETTDQEALESLHEELHAARVSLNYTIYYPLNDKYISLYAEQKQKKPSQSESADDTYSGADEKDTTVTMTLANTEKPPMWFTVEKCMEEGTLDLLREGKLNIPGESGGDTKKASTTTEKKKGVAKKASKESKKPMEKKDSRTKSKQEPEPEPVNRRSRRNAAREEAIMRKAQTDDGDDSDGGFFEM